jgi:hypothetical protein
LDNEKHRKTAIKISEAVPLPSVMYVRYCEYNSSEDNKRINNIPVAVKDVENCLE